MKVFSILTRASSIMAAAIQSPQSQAPPASLIGNYLNKTRPAYFNHDDVRVICGDPSDYPNTEFPSTDYNYPIGLLLSGGSRKINLQAGPRKCTQAACNAGGGAGVFICNDQPKSIDVLYTDAGWFAQRVFEKCKDRRNGVDYVEKGQAFCPDNWNVILSDVGDVCTASTLPGSD
ncbi:hypothetical protein F4806DRAFT_502456 [Annulohypoxylon nitens]|nr:hypothetical protein F4806DRAFT_502456 [Annulohypoxylon nitens]